MKNPKRLTRAEFDYLQSIKLSAENWLISKKTSENWLLVHKLTGTTKSIPAP